MLYLDRKRVVAWPATGISEWHDFPRVYGSERLVRFLVLHNHLAASASPGGARDKHTQYSATTSIMFDLVLGSVVVYTQRARRLLVRYYLA